MERCPCCNARLRERLVCSRCKTDISILVAVEKKADYWLSQAIQHALNKNIEHCISAIEASLQLKKTTLSLQFRQFFIQQQCADIIDLLAEKKVLFAKQKLYKMQQLFPHSQQLQQLHTFSEYLLIHS